MNTKQNGDLLKVENLTKSFGGVVANKNVDLKVKEGEILGLIGPNGAGKTTLFNMITGTRPEGSTRRPDKGRVYFKDQDITGIRPSKVCDLGLVRTFQLTRTWKEMTVLENVMTGAFNQINSRALAADRARDLLDFTGLGGKADQLGGSLTVADEKRLEITRALATGPVLMLLDEPMAGLTSKEINEALELVNKIHENGISILLVEHVMEAVMNVAHRIVVLDNGEVIADDKPENVAEDDRVIEAYLGEEYHVEN